MSFEAPVIRASLEYHGMEAFGTEPDPHWRYVDGAGHVHAWDGDRVPTTKKVHTCPASCRLSHLWARMWGRRRPCPHRVVLECSECGEEIKPRTRPIYRLLTNRGYTEGSFVAHGDEIEEWWELHVSRAPFDLSLLYPTVRGLALVTEITSEMEHSPVVAATVTWRSSEGSVAWVGEKGGAEEPDLGTNEGAEI